jgi:hypothetical protein
VSSLPQQTTHASGTNGTTLSAWHYDPASRRALAPSRFLIHDRDSRYGASFDRRAGRRNTASSHAIQVASSQCYR